MKRHSEDYNRAADITIGISLCLCSLLGTIFNTTALSYFTTKPTTSRNARYFRAVYVTISAVDLLISISLFPFIEAAFTEERDGRLFSKTVSFCTVWSVLWQVLPEMSVFLVAFISVSRFLLLVSPTKQFRPNLGWVVPLVYGICTLAFKVGLIGAGIMFASYLAKTLSCMIIVDFPGGEDALVSQEDWNWELVMRILASIQSGMTVIPISLSCCLSILYLHRAEKNAEGVASTVKGGTTKQREATITVILITIIYIIFNIPTLVYYIHHTRWSASFRPGEMTKADIGHSLRKYFDTQFEGLYMWVVLATMCTALNSVVNPLLYYWRMQSFKKFVRRNVKVIGALGRSVTSVSNTVSEGNVTVGENVTAVEK